MQLTRDDIDHVPKIIGWQYIGLPFGFQGLEASHRCTMDISGYKRNPNPFYASKILQLLYEPITFFL
jgi:hypothetical protein